MRALWLLSLACAASTPEVANHVEPMPSLTPEVPFVGNPRARVVVTYYFDYECPHCVDYAPELEALEKRYGDRIVVYYKDFPISHHRRAKPAAIAAEAARRQGKYFEMYHLLIRTSPRFEDAELRADAQQIGLDLARFDVDVRDPAAAARVSESYQAGETAGIMGTPEFVVGHDVVDADKLPAAIDAALQ
jgi:protein-disulfide isomerase